MRRWLAIAVLCSMVSAAHAQKEPCAMPGENNAFLGIQRFGCGRARRRKPRGQDAKTFRR